MFAYAAREHMHKFGTSADAFTQIAYKNHKHSVNNPYAAVQKEFPLQQIKKSRVMLSPIRRLESCPTGDGAAAVVVCSDTYLAKHPQLKSQAVAILAQALVTDLPSSFAGNSYLSLSGYDMARQAAQQGTVIDCVLICFLLTAKVFKEAGLSPKDVAVVECHDCFSCAELFMYEALGFCGAGEGEKFLKGGSWIRSPNGGDLFQLGSFPHSRLSISLS